MMTVILKIALYQTQEIVDARTSEIIGEYLLVVVALELENPMRSTSFGIDPFSKSS